MPSPRKITHFLHALNSSVTISEIKHHIPAFAVLIYERFSVTSCLEDRQWVCICQEAVPFFLQLASLQKVGCSSGEKAWHAIFSLKIRLPFEFLVYFLFLMPDGLYTKTTAAALSSMFHLRLHIYIPGCMVPAVITTWTTSTPFLAALHNTPQ